MIAPLQVFDPDMATLPVERVFVNASGELRARVSHVECSIETTEELVGAGFVIVQPLNPRLARQHPIFSALNVSGFIDEFWCVSTDPRLVNGAARFNVLKRHGKVVTGQELWPGEQYF